MIYFALFSALVGIGTVWMMRDEIGAGYARHSDYWLVIPLLCVGGGVLYWAAATLPVSMSLVAFITLPAKAALIMGFIVLFWGATISAGALLLKLFTTPSS